MVNFDLVRFRGNGGHVRIVTPAKAGVQCVKLGLSARFKAWMPAFDRASVSAAWERPLA